MDTFCKPTFIEEELGKEKISLMGTGVPFFGGYYQVPNRYLELLKEAPILVITASEDFLNPISGIRLGGGTTGWHRDVSYPVLGIYKPKKATRSVPTEFTITNNDRSRWEEGQLEVP